MRKLKNNELERKSVKEYKTASKTPFIIVLDNIRSLNNIGSVFRTSDGFLLEGIYLCGITAQPPHRDIHKTALGATESVNWKHYQSTIEAINDLKKDGYKVYSVEQAKNSIMLNNFAIKAEEKYALIFGNEVKGVDQKVVDLSDGCIEIPQYGTKHSFNISISAGIVLWDLFNKFQNI